MRVLLLNPTVRDHAPVLRSERCQVRMLGGLGLWPPIALAETAAVLRNAGHTVTIIDAVVDCVSHAAMLDRVIAQSPEAVLLQNTTPTVSEDLHTAAQLRARLPDVRQAFFGLHATVRPEDLLGPDTAVDAVLRHEPEQTACELIDAWSAGRPLDGIAGLARRGPDGALVVHPDRPLVHDLDALPWPARDLLAQDKYLLPVTGKPFTIIKTSRGCPFHCTYCTARPYSLGQWRVRSPQSIAAEISDVQQRYHINDFMFLADTFNVREDWVLDLCGRLAALDRIPAWLANSRCDTVSPAQAAAMKKAGCWVVSLGIESGSPRVLAACRKGITVAQSEYAVRVFRDAGIRTIAYFMFGLPGETRETIGETMALLSRLDPDYAYFFAATPFPGTEFFRQAEAAGWLASFDWSRYYHGTSDVISYPNLTNAEIQAAVRHAYRSFYLRPRVVLRELARLRSPAALWSSLRSGCDLLRAVL